MEKAPKKCGHAGLRVDLNGKALGAIEDEEKKRWGWLMIGYLNQSLLDEL